MSPYRFPYSTAVLVLVVVLNIGDEDGDYEDDGKVHDALLAGMERASDTVVPRVHQHRSFRPFVEDQLTAICAGRPCWMAQMGVSLALRDTPRGDAVVMVGPEGGFVPFELELAQAVIAQPVHLGSRTLSVDTALTTALAQG